MTKTAEAQNETATLPVLWWFIGWGNALDSIETVKETDKCLYVPSKYRDGKLDRISKESGYRTYYRTRDEAVAARLARLQRTVESNERELAAACSELAKFRAECNV